jgi:hypothetical protein
MYPTEGVLQPQPTPGSIKSITVLTPEQIKGNVATLNSSAFSDDFKRVSCFINGIELEYTREPDGEAKFTKQLKDLGLSEGEITTIKQFANQMILREPIGELHNQGISASNNGLPVNFSIVIAGDIITVTSNDLVWTKARSDQYDDPYSGITFIQTKAEIPRGLTQDECFAKTKSSYTLFHETPFKTPLSGSDYLIYQSNKLKLAELTNKMDSEAEERILLEQLVKEGDQMAKQVQETARNAFREASNSVDGFNEPPFVANDFRIMNTPQPLVRINPLANSTEIKIGNETISPSTTNLVFKKKLEKALEASVDNLIPLLGERTIGNHLEEMSALLGRDDFRIRDQKWHIEREGSDIHVKIQLELLSTNANGNEEIVQTEREMIIPINLMRTASFPSSGTVDELRSIFDNAITIIDSSKL